MKPAIGDKVTTYLGRPATIVDTDGNGRYKTASGLWWTWDGETLQEAEAPETAPMFELDVSRVYRNKEGYEAGGYKTNTSFKTETHTPESFVETVLREGYPFTMKHAKRSPEETGAAARGVVTAKHTENFISAQILVGDDDHKETGGAAWWLGHDFFSRCGFAFAESASSTPERQKGHAIFLFDRPITDAALYKECLQALCSYYPRLDWLVNVDRTIYSAQGAPVHLLGNICPFAEFEREVLAPHRADEAEKRAALEAKQTQRRAEYERARANGATVSQDQEERYLAGFLDWLFRHVAETAKGENRNRKVYWAGREIAGVEASTWAQPYLHLLSDVDARIVEAATANGYLDEHANGNAGEVLRVFNRGRLAGGEPIDPPMPRVTAAPSGSASTATPQASTNGAGPEKASAQDVPPGPDGEPAQGWTVALANAICTNNHFARSEAGELHYWKGGVYRRGGKQRIARLCKELLAAWGRPDVFTSYRAGEVAHFIAADAPELWTRPPADKLNVRNGLLDLTTPGKAELLPHDPAWLSTIQLPVDYDPEVRPDQWLRFISDWFPEDAQETPWELLAYLIATDIALQKAVLLLGNGENGKSRFLAALKAFLGARNVAALSLHQMEGSRWATHHLNGKLANICPDLPATGLDTTSVFKAITGGDMVPAEKKHGELYEYMPFVRLLFSANQPPQSRDASRAFFRRWIVVPFDATFSPAVKLPEQEIDALLAAPRQLSGALNMALKALPDVRRRGIVETESMREAHRQFHEVTDPVHVWLETNLVELPEAYIVKGDLLKAYNQAARANGNPPLTAQQFGRAVSEWRPQLQDGQKRIADARPLVWYGIGLKSDVRA